MAVYRMLGYFTSIATVFLLTVSTMDAATIRFEAESTGAVKDKNDAVGYGNHGIMGVAVDATASDGNILFTTLAGRKTKIIFAGTGIDLIAPETVDGAAFNWSLNEGALTGSGTTIGAGGAQTSIPIVSGLANGLHTLEIEKANNVDFVLRVDAFDVHDSGDRTRIEQNDPAISYSPFWQIVDTNPGEAFSTEASDGSVAWTITNGETATLNFTGTGIAAIIADRIDGKVFNYDIDGGAVTGSFDTSALAAGVGGGISNRIPYLLANDLSDGPHTLTITSSGVGAAGGINFIGFIDAFDVFQPIPEPSSLAMSMLGLMMLVRVRSTRRLH